MTDELLMSYVIEICLFYLTFVSGLHRVFIRSCLKYWETTVKHFGARDEEKLFVINEESDNGIFSRWFRNHLTAAFSSGMLLGSSTKETSMLEGEGTLHLHTA